MLFRSVLTDASGIYSFFNVPDGCYRIVEAYGTAGGAPTPGDFSSAVVGNIPAGVNPPISAACNPPAGATNLDAVTPNTLLVTVSGCALTGLNFFNGPVVYTPIQIAPDACATISGENLIQAADGGTFGGFPQGTAANTGAPTVPYPGVTPDFTYVLPNPAAYTPGIGEYTVQNIMNHAQNASVGAWWRAADHTTGNETGRMMIVNGANAGAVFFRATVPVRPNANYLFTAWILNLFKTGCDPAPAFGMRVLGQNGAVLYSATLGVQIPANVAVPEWKQAGSVVNASDNTRLTLELLREGPEGVGSGYAIDDIAFREILLPAFLPVKSVDKAVAGLGETIRYTVTLRNACANRLENVSFRDTLPNGLAFVPGSVSINGEANPSTDPNAGFSLPPLPGGDSVTVTFSATVAGVPCPNPAVNRAYIHYTYTPVEGGIPSVFDAATNPVSVTVPTFADLAVAKTASPTPVEPGETLTYFITVTNAGPAAADGVTLSDQVPVGLSNVTVSTDGGDSFSPWYSPYPIGALAAGESRLILLRGSLSTAVSGEIVNTAEVYSPMTDPNLSNNRATVRTPIRTGADLSLLEIASPVPVARLCRLTYTLTVFNHGPETAEAAVLSDAMPAELCHIMYSTDNGNTWQKWTGGLSLGNLAAGAVFTVRIAGTVRACANGCIENTAVVSSQTADPNPANNTASVTTSVCRRPCR